MYQSDSIDQLLTALSKAQSIMEHASKDTNNPFYKSKYADLAEVWRTCRDPLAKNGLCILQCVEIDGDRQALVTTLGHNSGQFVKSKILLPICNKTQEFGAVITYFRRYALSAIVGIYQDDDDANSVQETVDMKTVRYMSESQKRTLREMLDKIRNPELEDFLCKRAKIKNLMETPQEKYHDLMEYLEKKLKEAS